MDITSWFFLLETGALRLPSKVSLHLKVYFILNVKNTSDSQQRAEIRKVFNEVMNEVRDHFCASTPRKPALCWQDETIALAPLFRLRASVSYSRCCWSKPTHPHQSLTFKLYCCWHRWDFQISFQVSDQDSDDWITASLHTLDIVQIKRWKQNSSVFYLLWLSFESVVLDNHWHISEFSSFPDPSSTVTP